ncbi:hypothetical protein [uncultured Gilliamella sp.]|uniref:hypothetical protein n=1 Tax=uncultured Gilliamella sp. TaxID=1193505 RepID=UPI0025EF7887|nr:hypothetical protein [uncultured Gilliamella sp.]
MYKAEIDWSHELHQTVVKSLATSFGLDFLLFKDKDGGDVDTIHNVRKGIYATEKEKEKYDNRGKYDSHKYHSHRDYIATNKQGKIAHQQGELYDEYTGKTFNDFDKVNQDHVISGNEIHHDAGRNLADMRGEDLANAESNLCFTNENINKKKQDKSMEQFTLKLQNEYIENQQKIAELKNKPHLTEQEQKELKKLENIVNADLAKMKKIDEKARADYNQKINREYYTSSKFLKNITKQAAISGFKMGTRQMQGLILAEVWFELKESIPAIYEQNRQYFTINGFINDLMSTFNNIWHRIKKKFHTFFIAFKDSAIGGVLSSVSTTVINIFFTTQKQIGKMLREIGGNLVQAIKLIFFNPQSLPLGQLIKEVGKIIGAGIAASCGGMINSMLSQVSTFPFGAEIAAFCSTLVTGIITLGAIYYLENGKICQKIWSFLDNFSDNSTKRLNFYREVNKKLDCYLLELYQLEFNIDTEQLELFSLRLSSVNNELERSFILKEEIDKRNIKLPYEMGNCDSIKSWLNSR